MNDKRTQSILDRRAAELARPADPPQITGERSTFFCFRIHDDVYAIDASHAIEAFAMNHCTPVPQTPDFVLGVTAIHGEIFSIVDISRLLGRPSTAVTNLNRIVVVRVAELKFGIVSDAPEGLREINIETLREVPGDRPGAQEEFIRGLSDGGEIVLDLDALYRSGRLIVAPGAHTHQQGASQ